MKRLLISILFCIAVSFPLQASYYWDFPRYIAKTADKEVKSDIKAIDVGEEVLIFFLAERKKSAQIEFFSTRDFAGFKGPFISQSGIELKKGFSPHFDVLYAGGILFLAWNSIDGAIMVSTSPDQGSSWQNAEILIKHENFSFAPVLFFENGTVYLFYHTESEGTKIDFFYTESKDLGETWSRPFQIARGFSGSFFPSLSFYQGNLYLVWQSRPLSETQLPIFNVYLSVNRDQGKSWSPPVNLTEDTLGENTLPVITFEGDNFNLIWEGERNGVSGIYYREFDLSGTPLSEEVKVNGQMSNARYPVRLVVNDDLVVFYLDARDGNDRMYYSVRKNGKFEESGPLGMKGKDIFGYSAFTREKNLYLLMQERGGIVFLGPDTGVLPVKVIPLKSKYIGQRGVVVKWEDIGDSSGIEGYSYSFNREELDEPELINLPSHSRSINLSIDEEGEYYFHLRAVDRAGNYSTTETVPFIGDLTPPPAPVLVPIELDEDGFWEDNSPTFKWSIDAPDVAGFNFTLTKNEITLKNPRLRTTRKRARYQSVEGGSWNFNVAAVDRAGNIGETSSFALRLKPLPPPVEKIIKIVPPWILSRETFKTNPILNISLYLVLGGLLFVTFYISTDIILRLMVKGEGVQMEEKSDVTGIRKKRFGLRFKFSVMVAGLILIVTIGISSILSFVSIENQRRALGNQMMDKALLSLDNMTNVAREGILNNDELLLLSVIAKTMANRDINYSVILDVNNRVIAHSDINERGKILTDEVTRKASESDEILVYPEFIPDELEKMYILSSPVMVGEKKVGYAQIGYSTESIFKTINDARRTNIFSALYVTAVTIIVGIIGAIIMASITIKPIKILAKGVNIIGEGRLDYKIHIKSRDEIGLLSDEFNRMTSRLLEYQNKMQEKAKLDEQLEIARQIQQDLIPQDGIDNKDISIDGFYKAAAGVGGDYYDFVQIGEGKYGVIMSDVAGKGVPASLMMIMIRTVFKSLIQSGLSEPSKIVTLMNDTLASDISSDRFATVLFGVFNQHNRLFHYTNAGYGPLLVYKEDKKKCFLVNPPKGSVPIGVMPDVEYEEEKPITLGSGDSLFLFTDGIHEARNISEEEYGMKRLSDIIPPMAARASKDMANLIVEDVLRFAGEAEQYDDMTLTVMKVK